MGHTRFGIHQVVMPKDGSFVTSKNKTILNLQNRKGAPVAWTLAGVFSMLKLQPIEVSAIGHGNGDGVQWRSGQDVAQERS
jgi:hypothetical protein